MNICFYTDTFFPWVGGAETVLDNLARELTGLGHAIVVLAPGPRTRMTSNIRMKSSGIENRFPNGSACG